MRHIEIDMKEILVDRIKEELGDDGEILRAIPITIHDKKRSVVYNMVWRGLPNISRRKR